MPAEAERGSAALRAEGSHVYMAEGTPLPRSPLLPPPGDKMEACDTAKG